MSGQPPTLRPYQHAAVADVIPALAAGSNTLLVAPTGSGKTVMFASVAATYAARGEPVLVIAHRRELLTQAADKLAAAGVEASVYRGKRSGYAPAPVVVASVQTGAPQGFAARLVIVDEAHHAPAESYQRLVAQHPGAVVLGVTATPWWQSQKPLDDLFPVTVRASTVRDLVASGHLARVRMFTHPHTLRDLDLRGVATAGGDYTVAGVSERADKPALIGDMVEHWRTHAGSARTLAFAASVTHSRHIVERFVAAGIAAEHIDGTTPDAERKAILARLESGATRVVSNYAVLSEGFDAPAVGCVILARPTKRVGVYLQCVGRGMRKSPERDDVVVLDHAGSCIMHGLPDEERDIVEPQRRGNGKPPVRRCPSCGLCVALGTMECPECSTALRREVPTEEPAGALVEVACADNQGMVIGGRWLLVPEICRITGLSEASVRGRLRKNVSEEEMLAPARARRSFGLVTIDDRSMPVSAWAKEAGRAAPHVYRRLRSGMAPRDAIFGPAVSVVERQLLSVDARHAMAIRLRVGDADLTFAEWEERTGVSQYTIRQRLKRGYSPEECIAVANYNADERAVERRARTRLARRKEAKA